MCVVVRNVQSKERPASCQKEQCFPASVIIGMLGCYMACYRTRDKLISTQRPAPTYSKCSHVLVWFKLISNLFNKHFTETHIFSFSLAAKRLKLNQSNFFLWISVEWNTVSLKLYVWYYFELDLICKPQYNLWLWHAVVLNYKHINCSTFPKTHIKLLLWFTHHLQNSGSFG